MYRLHLFLGVAAIAALPFVPTKISAAVGDIYETNQDLILLINPNTVGTPATFVSGLSNPKGLIFDGIGHLYVADANRGIIIRFTPPDNAGVAYLSNLSSPVGVMFDRGGNFYIGEAGAGIVTKIAAVSGNRTTYASGLGQPAGLAFALNGDLLVSDFSGGVIYRVDPDGVKTTFATGLNLPSGLAFDSADNLFVADSGSGTILKFAPDGSRTTFASGLSRPYGLVFEASGNLVVSDNGNGTTFRFTPSGDRSVIFSSEFNTPQFVAVQPATHQLLNMSTRGFVEGGDHVLIAGFIVGGTGPVATSVVIRALGPSLANAGIKDPLPDPVLEVRNVSGTLIAMNDNWEDADPTQVVQTAFAPSNPDEAAVQLLMSGGTYTAVVYGTGDKGTTGTALVEVYNLQ